MLFGKMYGYEEFVVQTINGYKNEKNEYKFSVPIDDGYDAKYTEIFTPFYISNADFIIKLKYK
jgi:hypothetical protein